MLAHELERAAQLGKLDAKPCSRRWPACTRCRGAYAIVALIAGDGLLAFRDPYGIRPLIIGVNETEGRHRVSGGERVGGARGLGFRCCATSRRARPCSSTWTARFHAPVRGEPALNPCIFEYVYLARPDSVIDGVSVYETRLRMGEQLAEKIATIPEAQDIDVVIPIPESSRPSAMELA